MLTYNNAIQTFPGVLVAGPFNFAKREFFETDEAERSVPQVDFTPDAPRPAPPAEPSGPAPGGTP